MPGNLMLKVLRFMRIFRNKYERDSYRCISCGVVGGRLNTHHLDGWNWCISKRYDLENVVTICENCHRCFHVNFGYGNNNKDQFIEFLEQRGIIYELGS